MAFATGMRIGELLDLKWSRIDWTKRTALIDQQASELSGKVTLKKPKTNAGIRTIELTDAAVQALLDHQALTLREGNAKSPFVFCSPEGHVMSRGNVRTRWWNPLLKRIGVEPRGIHHTRHTYATHALQAGIPLITVSRIMGHGKPSITQDIYGHVMPDSTSAATATINRLFG